jgi:Yip1 domain
MDAAGLQSLVQSYINAVTKPSAGTYEGELRNASWTKVLIGIAAVAVVGAIMNLLFAQLASSTYDQFFNQFQQQFGSQGNADLGQYRSLARGGGPLGALISPFITFFLGSGLLFLMAKIFGGQGGDFLTHSYLLSLSYTPLRIASSLLGIIPCVNVIAGLALALYQLYSAGLAMQASQRMEPRRAQMAVFLPAIVGLILVCLCAVLFFGLLVAVFSGTSNR